MTRYAIPKPEPLRTEHEAFRDAVLGKDADIVTMRAGLATVAVADAVLAVGGRRAGQSSSRRSPDDHDRGLPGRRRESCDTAEPPGVHRLPARPGDPGRDLDPCRRAHGDPAGAQPHDRVVGRRGPEPLHALGGPHVRHGQRRSGAAPQRDGGAAGPVLPQAAGTDRARPGGMARRVRRLRARDRSAPHRQVGDRGRPARSHVHRAVLLLAHPRALRRGTAAVADDRRPSGPRAGVDRRRLPGRGALLGLAEQRARRSGCAAGPPASSRC